jgi:hypothetical protein
MRFLILPGPVASRTIRYEAYLKKSERNGNFRGNARSHAFSKYTVNHSIRGKN